MSTTSDDPDGPSGPDAELIAALDDTVGRAVLAALRSGPRTVAELVASTGHDEAAVWAALHALTAQGVVTADHPRLPGDVVYRIDSAALTGFRGLGRWFRSRSSALNDGPRPPSRRSQQDLGVATDGGPAVGEPATVAAADDHPATAAPSDAPSIRGAGTDSSDARARPSVAAWTNPAVKAALQRLEEQQRRPR